MRIHLPGKDPLVAALNPFLTGGGHALTPTVADAEIILCSQPVPVDDTPVYRTDTSRLLMKLAHQLRGPIVISLVSFEPNLLWPANFCHVCESPIRGNSGYPFAMTRTHFRSKLPERDCELILGADADEVRDLLLAVWQPCLDPSAQIITDRVFAAELLAEKVLTPHS